MDILVCIPAKEEEHVRATKLNPVSGLTDGYWTLGGCPRFARAGDRIWFSLFGEVIASARIGLPKDDFPAGAAHPDDEPENGRYLPAVSFHVPTVVGHEFSAPRELPMSFRGFRYVRRVSKYVPAKKTQRLEVVGAKEAERLYPRNW